MGAWGIGEDMGDRREVGGREEMWDRWGRGTGRERGDCSRHRGWEGTLGKEGDLGTWGTGAGTEDRKGLAG